MIESIKWYYEATPERLKAHEMNKKIVAFFIYASILLYVWFVYDGANTSTFLVIFFGMLYVLEVIIWKTWLAKKIVFNPYTYTANQERLEIINLNNGSTRIYNWADFRSYADNPKVYDAQAKSSMNNESLFLGKKSKIPQVYITLKFDDKDKNRVTEFIATKLEKEELK